MPVDPHKIVNADKLQNSLKLNTPAVGGFVPAPLASSTIKFSELEASIKSMHAFSPSYGGWNSNSDYYLTSAPSHFSTGISAPTKSVDLLACLQLLKPDEAVQIQLEVIGVATIVHVIVFTQTGHETHLKFTTKDKHEDVLASFTAKLEEFRALPPPALPVA